MIPFSRLNLLRDAGHWLRPMVVTARVRKENGGKGMENRGKG